MHACFCGQSLLASAVATTIGYPACVRAVRTFLTTRRCRLTAPHAVASKYIRRQLRQRLWLASLQLVRRARGPARRNTRLTASRPRAHRHARPWRSVHREAAAAAVLWTSTRPYLVKWMRTHGVVDLAPLKETPAYAPAAAANMAYITSYRHEARDDLAAAAAGGCLAWEESAAMTQTGLSASELTTRDDADVS